MMIELLKPRSRSLFSLLILALALLLQGCESSPEFVATGSNASPDDAVVATTETGTFSLQGKGELSQRVSGTVWLEKPGPATVRLFMHNGEPRIEATLPDNRVLLADLSQPEVDSLVLLGQDGEGPFETGDWVWITPLSTMLAVYRDLHPELSHTDRLANLKGFLGIAETESINRPFSSVANSQFWPAAFLEAAGDRSLVDFSRDLIGQLESTRAQSIFDDPPEEVPAVPGPGRLVGFVDNVGAGLVTDVLWKALGFAVGKTFLGNSTRQQLSTIENELDEVNTQLDNIEQSLNGLGTGTLAASVDTTALQPLFTYYTKEKAMLNQSQTEYTPFSFNNASFLTSDQVEALTSAGSAGDALGYAEGIVGACLNTAPSSGQGNIIAGFTQSTANPYGSGTSTFNGANTAFFYDFRNDVLVTGALQQCTDYYLGYLGHAANMLSESLTASLGTNLSVPASGIQQAQGYVNGSGFSQILQGDASDNGVLALAKRIQQQRPLALLGGQSALANVFGAPAVPETIAGTGNVNGTLWANCSEVTQANTDKGPATPIYLETVGQFNVNGYYNWFLPSKSEVEALCQSAAQVAKADGVGSSSQQVPYGLHKLGLLSDANYKSGMTNVGIYFGLSADKDNPACQVYETKDGSTDSGMFEAGLNAYGFSPTKDNVRLVLVVRPFPGLPQGAGGKAKNATATGAATTSGPDAVVNSSSAGVVRGAGNQLFMWNSGLALAGNLPPTEIVVARDSNSNQLRAYGIWLVGWPVVPSVYLNTNDTFTGLYKYYPNLGPTPSQYLVYTELTDMAEWLSSDTNAIEVSNYAESHISTYGGTATGVTLSGPELIIEDPVLQTQGISTRITGGRVIFARLLEPSGGASGVPSLSGATSVALGTPIGNVDPSGSTVSGGNITGGVLDSDQGLQIFTLTDAGGTAQTIATGGGVRNATIEDSYLSLPYGYANMGGVLRSRNAGAPATITASWMTSPSTTTLTNSNASAATFKTGTISLAAGSVIPAPSYRSLLLSPNFANVQLVSGGQSLTFYTTAFNADGSCSDLSAEPGTVYSVFQQVGNDQTFQEVPTALISFGGVDAGGQPVQPNVMKVHAGFNNYSGTLIIRAVNGHDSGYSFLQVLSPP